MKGSSGFVVWRWSVVWCVVCGVACLSAVLLVYLSVRPSVRSVRPSEKIGCGENFVRIREIGHGLVLVVRCRRMQCSRRMREQCQDCVIRIDR